MGRIVLISLLLAVAGGFSAAAQQARAPAPAGISWQSVPLASETRTGTGRIKPAASPAKSAERKARLAEMRPAAGSKRKPTARRPVAAGALSALPPRNSAAARALELSRRIDALAPGTKLGRPMSDPENPHWRRRASGRAGPDGNAFAVPLDGTGRSGFVARGYHEEPSWHNPAGNTGATFGLRTRF